MHRDVTIAGVHGAQLIELLECLAESLLRKQLVDLSQIGRCRCRFGQLPSRPLIERDVDHCLHALRRGVDVMMPSGIERHRAGLRNVDAL